jgi:DNA-binding MarR family transcriptional regulator
LDKVLENPPELVEADTIGEILHLGHLLAKTFQADVAPIVLELDLSMAQVKILFILATENPVTVGIVADKLGIGFPTASYQVDKVVQAGLVCRAEDANDRRRTLVFLTPTGEELVQRLGRGRKERLCEWLNQLNVAERQSLLVGLKAMVRVANLSEPHVQKS